MADLPLCENYELGKCPKSDVVMYAEHGPPQMTYYISFGCKTCKMMFVKWEPGMLDAAKKQTLDKNLINLVNPDRFKGWG